MIKEIRYGRSNYLNLVIPAYIRTDNKDYAWSEQDLIYFLMILKTRIHLII